jgi:hypothetical protein
MAETRTVTIETEKGTLCVQIDANLIDEFVKKATHGPNRRMHKTSLDALTTAVFYGFTMFLEDMERGRPERPGELL